MALRRKSIRKGKVAPRPLRYGGSISTRLGPIVKPVTPKPSGEDPNAIAQWDPEEAVRVAREAKEIEKERRARDREKAMSDLRIRIP